MLIATDIHLFVTVYKFVFAYCCSFILKMEALCEDAGVIKEKENIIPVNGKIIEQNY